LPVWETGPSRFVGRFVPCAETASEKADGLLPKTGVTNFRTRSGQNNEMGRLKKASSIVFIIYNHTRYEMKQMK
jgi:hypothetical protein